MTVAVKWETHFTEKMLNDMKTCYIVELCLALLSSAGSHPAQTEASDKGPFERALLRDIH